MYLTPSDFIGRCLDAANTSLIETLPAPISCKSFQVAGITLRALPGPLSFEMNGFDFTVEMTDMHEMMQFTAVMVHQLNHNCYEASMVISKLTNSIIEHWLCDEPSDHMDDLILLKLMTSNRFNNSIMPR